MKPLHRARALTPFVAWLGILSILLAAVGEDVNAQETLDDSAVATGFPTDEYESTSWRVRAEYLLWWAKGNPIPALVTTSPAGTPVNQAGVLGTPGAEVLYGDDDIGNEIRSGFRTTLTHWLDQNPTRALEFVFDYVGDDTHTGDYSAESLGTPILSRPFLNANALTEDAELVAFPGQLSGRVEVVSSSQAYSGEALLRQVLRSDDRGWIDMLVGYRFFRFEETLGVREDLLSTNPGGLIPLGARFQVFDDFSTENDFHGGELGLNAEYFRGIFSVELIAKVALGNVQQTTSIAGHTVTTIAGFASTSEAGGLLALPSNIGTRTDNDFGVLPELGIQGKVQLTQNFNAFCGYSLLLLNDAARTGEQIDRVVNPTQIGGQPLAGPARPGPTLADSDFWLQGINLGFDLVW